MSNKNHNEIISENNNFFICVDSNDDNSDVGSTPGKSCKLENVLTQIKSVIT